MTRVPAPHPFAPSRCATSSVDVVFSSSSTDGSSRSEARSSAFKPSKLYASATPVDDRQHHDAENDSIQGEHTIAVLAHVSEKHCDREPAAHRRRNHADKHLHAEPALLQDVRRLENDCRSRDRHAHEKAEDRRRLTVEPECPARCYRRSRPRDAGHERDHLCDSNQQRIDPLHSVERRFLRREAVDRPEDYAHDDQRRCRQRRSPEDSLRLLLEKQSTDCSGNCRQDQEDHALLLGRIDRSCPDNRDGGGDQLPPLPPKQPEDSEQSSEMKRDVERESGILPAEEEWRERQVGRAADWKEFGETLNQSEYDRLKDCHAVIS